MKDKKLIPLGIYCYAITGRNPKTGRIQRKICPFWSMRKDKPEQVNGYCSYLEEGDWEFPGGGLLWDQVKECGINMGDDNGQE